MAGWPFFLQNKAGAMTLFIYLFIFYFLWKETFQMYETLQVEAFLLSLRLQYVVEIFLAEP